MKKSILTQQTLNVNIKLQDRYYGITAVGVQAGFY